MTPVVHKTADLKSFSCWSYLRNRPNYELFKINLLAKVLFGHEMRHNPLHPYYHDV
jgi:hypothetical protein